MSDDARDADANGEADGVSRTREQPRLRVLSFRTQVAERASADSFLSLVREYKGLEVTGRGRVRTARQFPGRVHTAAGRTLDIPVPGAVGTTTSGSRVLRGPGARGAPPLVWPFAVLVWTLAVLATAAVLR